jgi:hypothetical protein
MLTYPYVNFRECGTVVHQVECDNTDVRDGGCPYLESLEARDYTYFDVRHTGRITDVELNFYLHNWARKFPYPKASCALCPWNRDNSGR